jgi:uncharacterized protein involved in exopolysaccharide biosynthesis
VEPLSLRHLWSAYWKVPVVGLLAATLAFIGSFVLTPTYQSSAHLLVRARNATFLSGTGTSLTQTPAVLDSDLAKALSDTQGALASTDTVARMVVRDLAIDGLKPKPQGIVGTLRRYVGNTYRHTKAFLMYGGYKTPPPRQGAIQAVNRGISGAQVKDSFVLELTAKADRPKLAAAIANSAADALVKIANDRFARDSVAYRDLLKKQLRAAQRDEVRASQAIADFQRRNGITDVGTELTLSAQSRADLASRLQHTQSQLSATEAQLSSIQSQLASTPAQSSTSQKITTGRSSTTVDNTAASQLYQTLQSQQATLRAQASGLSAEVGALQTALNNTKSTAPLTQAQARLQQLALDQQVTQQTVKDLASQYQQARLNSVSNTVELTRVDNAIEPVFPIAPRRYMFLAVGLLLGMVLGFVSAQLGVLRRRQGENADADLDVDGDRDRDSVDLIDMTGSPEGAPVPAQRPNAEGTLTDRILGNGRARRHEGEH